MDDSKRGPINGSEQLQDRPSPQPDPSPQPGPTPEPHREPTPEERAKAAIQAEISIVVFKDGNFHMNGPWHDRIMFEGLMGVAADFMRQQFHELQAREMAKRQPKVQPITGMTQRDVERLRRGR
jgi:hypothetical protein